MQRSKREMAVCKNIFLWVAIFVGFIPDVICQDFDGREYHLHFEKKTYDEAELFCQQEYNGHLLDLRPLAADSMVNQLTGYKDRGDITSKDDFWIGLTHPVDTALWFDGDIFVRDSIRHQIPFMMNLEPDRCMTIKWSATSYEWVVKFRACTGTRGFICDYTTENVCGYCQHLDTDFSTTEMNETSRTETSVVSCEASCGDQCWFYVYKASEQTCSLYNSTRMPATHHSKSWFVTAPGSELYEKKCFIFSVHPLSGEAEDNQPCSIYRRPFAPQEQVTTWIAAETTNLLQVTTSLIVAESTVATSSQRESAISDTTAGRLEPTSARRLEPTSARLLAPTSSPTTTTSDMPSQFMSATNTLWVQPTSSLFGDITIRRDIFSTVVSSTSDLSAISLPSEFLQVTTEHWMPVSSSSDFSETPGPGNTVEFRSASTLDPLKNDFSAALVPSSSDFSSAISSKSHFPTTLIPSKVDDFTTELMPGTFSSDFIETPAILSDISGESSSAVVLDSLRYDISVSFQLSSSYGFGGSWIRDSLGLEVSAKLTSSNFEEFQTAWMLSTTLSATPALGSDEFNSAPSSFSLHGDLVEATISRSSVVFDAIGSSLTSGTVRTDIPSPSTAEGTRLHLNSVGSTTGVSLIAVPPTSHTLCDGGPQITPTYLAELTTTPTLQTRSVFPVFSVPINCSAICPCLRKYTDIREDLLRNITIDFQNLSSYKRLYYSAEDDRISVKVLGYTGVTCMVCFVLFVLLLDSSALWKVKDLVQIRTN